jgi:hypothetical protein
MAGLGERKNVLLLIESVTITIRNILKLDAKYLQVQVKEL